MSSSQLTEFTDTLQSSAADYGVTLDQGSVDGLGAYFEILNTWNARLHLVAPTSPAEFATRHVLESLTVLQYLHDNSDVADVGSGGGLPIVPALILRRDISATLIESSRKKAVFLREALKETKTAGRATVILLSQKANSSNAACYRTSFQMKPQKANRSAARGAPAPSVAHL